MTPITPTPPMEAAFVEQARVRMERRFRDLEIAEARGMPQHVIDRMFDAYMLAFREYDTAMQR